MGLASGGRIPGRPRTCANRMHEARPSTSIIKERRRAYGGYFWDDVRIFWNVAAWEPAPCIQREPASYSRGSAPSSWSYCAAYGSGERLMSIAGRRLFSNNPISIRVIRPIQITARSYIVFVVNAKEVANDERIRWWLQLRRLRLYERRRDPRPLYPVGYRFERFCYLIHGMAVLQAHSPLRSTRREKDVPCPGTSFFGIYAGSSLTMRSAQSL